MKILHVFKVYLPESFTGIERVIWNIAEATVAHGVQSTVFTLSPKPADSIITVARHGVVQARQHVYLASTGITLTGLNSFRRLALEADIVHYHFPWPMMDVLHLLAGTGTPSILTYHSDIVKQQWLMPLYRPLMDTFLSRMDRIVATSPDYLDSSPVLQRYRSKTEVIPIGLDPRGLASADPSVVEQWRSRLGEDFFLFVGANRYYKGLPILLDAGRATGLPVVIAGHGTAEAGRDVPSSFQVLGDIGEDDKAALLSLAGAFVFPSLHRSEAFGVALLEAAFAGLPMISCDIGTGTSYINCDGETGIVVPPGDAAALGAAMQELAADPSQRQRLGEAALRRAQRLFTADGAALKYVALYQDVLQRRG